MARSDLVLNLVKAGQHGDRMLFRKTIEALVVEERAKSHHVFADAIASYIDVTPKAGLREVTIPFKPETGIGELYYEVSPTKTVDDLVLDASVYQSFTEIIEEHNRQDLLRSYGVEPRHRIMLIGPPGNGKTSLAEAMATALMVPMIVVRYEGLIGSYLGETAARLAKLVAFVATRRCVLFLDEFDTLAKERGDIHDTGEIKRVVSSLLLQIDSLPSHVVALTATNHPELLDRAVWRRFQLQIRLDAPTIDQIKQFLSRFEKRFGQTLPINIPKMAAKLKGVTYADLENFVSDIQRRYILGLPNSDLKSILSRLLPSMMRRSKQRGRVPHAR